MRMNTRMVARQSAGSLSGARLYEIERAERVSISPSEEEWLRKQIQQRRARLIRISTIGLTLALLVLVVDAFLPEPEPASIAVALLALFGTATVYLLNEQGKVELAGALLTGIIAASIAGEVVLMSFTYGLAVADLRYFDLLALPVFLAALLINKHAPIVVASLSSFFTVFALFALPRGHGLEMYWEGKIGTTSSWLDVLTIAILFPWVVALVAWMGADSAERGMMQASRADELALANERILAQSRKLEAQRRTLQDGLAHIQQVHSAVARGQWETRVQIDNGELLPMAISLNLLLDRITRLSREQQELARIEVASHELAKALRRVWAGEPYISPSYTGTVFDEALIELTRLRRGTGRLALPEAPSQVDAAVAP